MGEHDIRSDTDGDELRRFTRSLLDDLRALQRLLEEGRIETGVRRAGAEQEMFLIDSHFDPASIAPDLLQRLNDPRFTTELGRYNLEANVPPLAAGGRFLSKLQAELEDIRTTARRAAGPLGADILLIGILPTLHRGHLTLDHMTPVPRYFELNRRLSAARGGSFRAHIEGIDEIKLDHDNVMLEACNTSFQLHWQVDPEHFERDYNLCQLITAPLLAAAVNSSVLLNRRLWHETRIALFEQSVDVRREAGEARGQSRRVGFGNAWLEGSILELFRSNVTEHRVLMTREVDEPATAVLDRGGVPELKALALHNGTVYRWNRPCYGVTDGKPHVRIENRVLPAGPTVLDQVVNAAFFYGLMAGMKDHVADPRGRIPFAALRANFVAAARQGLYAGFHWLDDRDWSADVLIREELLPVARAGLASLGTESADIDRYLGLLEERVRTRRTGALWLLQSLDRLAAVKSDEDRVRQAVAAFAEQQDGGKPIHEWVLAEPRLQDWRAGFRRVEQLMSPTLVTVAPDDLVDLAASVMDWRRLRHVAVEDDGRLVGLLTSRALIRLVARGEGGTVAVRDVMRSDVVTVEADAHPLEAIELMRSRGLGALPVVRGGRLVGIVSEADFLPVAKRVLEEALADERGPGQDEDGGAR